MSKGKQFIAEASQFVPVITLAFSFLVAGDVDLGRAGPLFVVSGIGAAIITAVLLWRRVVLNPILVGTNLWLCIGALAFGVPIAPLMDAVNQLRAVGLYACMLSAGAVMAFALPTGYIGMRHPDPKAVRKLSVILLGITAFILVWSFLFIDNIRLGGGLPFILVNITRRVMMRRSLKAVKSAAPT